MSESTNAPTRPWNQRPEVIGALVVGTLALLLSLARTLHEPGWPTDLNHWFPTAPRTLAARDPSDTGKPAR